ncbi:MAG: DNA internalization-related competence protein ComEC/Rec2 [Oscillospiraceae bacterium]|nr:DNA internalization-related competence protein ComEC/Rec2 [Oscillospiraceae bacterium]
MRKIMIVALSFSAAVFSSVYFLPARWILPLILWAAVCGIAVVLLRKRVPAYLALPAFGLCFGFLWFYGYRALFYAPAQSLVGKTETCEAIVLNYPQATRYGVKVLIQVESGADPFGIKTALYADKAYASLRPGNQLSFSARFKAADWIRDESVTYYTAQGVFLLANASGKIKISTPEATPPRFWPLAFSHTLQDVINRVFSSEISGFIRALVIGNLDGLTGSFSAALSRTGLSHMVSVSGMHLSFLVGVLMLLSGRGRRTALIGIPAILFFTAAVGNTPAVIRSAVMQILLLIAPLLRRETDWQTSLSASLMFLLLLNPFAAANVSLQLSFGSMTGILLLSQRISAGMACLFPKAALKRKSVFRVPIRFVLATFSSSVGAMVFTIPLVALYFGSVSLISPLANLLTLWAVSFVFVGGLCAGIAGLVWLPVGKGIAFLVSIPARYILIELPFLASLPFSAVYTMHFYTRAFLIFAYALAGLACFWPGGQKRVLLPLCCGVCGLCLTLLLNYMSMNSGALTASVLNVGQGQSVVFLSQGGAAVVDCGGSQAENAGDIAADYLQGIGITRVELLVLTHFHSDHAGGVPQLFERMQIRKIAIPDIDPDNPLRKEILALAKKEGTEVDFVRQDQGFAMGKAKLTLYAPLGTGGGNEEGLTILCSADAFDFLLTGDMNSTVEQRLIEHGSLPDVEVLVAGHHGSKYATGDALLKAVRPETAIISVGYNTYGQPAEETLERLKKAGVFVYRTDTMGMVTVKAGDRGSPSDKAEAKR